MLLGRNYSFGRLSRALDDSYLYPLRGDDIVRYDGKYYRYNKDLITFVVMGIDKEGKVAPNPDKVSGGQSDVIIVAAVNSKTKDMKLIYLDRNSMVPVTLVGMGENGEDLLSTNQICVQHGFGDGMEQSCRLTEECASYLLYNIPIDGYLSVNYGVIPLVTAYAQGGVWVTIPEGMEIEGFDWQPGQQVGLCHEWDTMAYLRYRDLGKTGSARERSIRHKDFITKLYRQLKAEIKRNPKMMIKLYNACKDYIVTDLDIFKVIYLASLYKSDLSFDDINYLQGNVICPDVYDEFYPDDEALQKLILEIFFEELE